MAASFVRVTGPVDMKSWTAADERFEQARERKNRFGSAGGSPWWDRLCTRCDKMFASVRLLEEHYRTHEFVGCPECSKKCYSRTACALHLKYVHKHLACAECFQLFQSNDELIEHMRATHTIADKVVILTRADSSWKASTMAGQQLFRFVDEAIGSVHELCESVAQAWGVEKEVLSFIANDTEAADTLHLADVDFLLVKRTMLVEPTTKKNALDDKRQTALR